MVLLIAGTLGFLFSLACALVLLLKLSPWPFVAGVSRLPLERKANVDVKGLARHYSVVFFSLAAFFLAGTLVLALRAIPESFVLCAYIFALLVAFNFFWTGFRKYDRNEYSDGVRRASRLAFITVNVLFLACLVVLAP
jgi:hypothetical protein